MKRDLPSMLTSILMNVDSYTLVRIQNYCVHNDMPLTIRSRDDRTLPYRIAVWGTKKQLREFKEYF